MKSAYVLSEQKLRRVYLFYFATVICIFVECLSVAVFAIVKSGPALKSLYPCVTNYYALSLSLSLSVYPSPSLSVLVSLSYRVSLPLLPC